VRDWVIFWHPPNAVPLNVQLRVLNISTYTLFGLMFVGAIGVIVTVTNVLFDGSTNRYHTSRLFPHPTLVELALKRSPCMGVQSPLTVKVVALAQVLLGACANK